MLRYLLLDLCSEPIQFSCPVFLVNAACCGCKHFWYAPPIPTSYPPAKRHPTAACPKPVPVSSHRTTLCRLDGLIHRRD